VAVVAAVADTEADDVDGAMVPPWAAARVGDRGASQHGDHVGDQAFVAVGDIAEVTAVLEHVVVSGDVRSGAVGAEDPGGRVLGAHERWGVVSEVSAAVRGVPSEVPVDASHLVVDVCFRCGGRRRQDGVDRMGGGGTLG
jgi:hypothetical protein